MKNIPITFSQAGRGASLVLWRCHWKSNGCLFYDDSQSMEWFFGFEDAILTGFQFNSTTRIKQEDWN